MGHELIGVAEAAKILCVDRSTIWRWVDTGKLTPFGYSRGPQRKRALFTRASVEEFAQNQRMAAVA